jgi:cell division protein FtsB
MAALAYLHASTKETFAMLNLAQMLFTEGQFQRAARYIKKSVDDASFYGARQRKVQLSTLLPIIQGSELAYIKQQRSYAIIYSLVLSLILLLFIFLLIVIFRQNKRLRKTQEELRAAHAQLSEAHARQQDLNVTLQQANTDLLDLNHRLEEANKIKEEYVGYFLNTSADSSQKFERLKLAIEEKLHYGKTSEIKYLLNGFNIHNEKQELLKSFDRVFLKLFPHFVNDFNNLLEEDHRIVLPEDQILNTDLRIYALQRVGIRDNEKIAEILEYSVKSIYAYKTRIRNRSRFPKENFDQLVMNIRSI